MSTIEADQTGSVRGTRTDGAGGDFLFSLPPESALGSVRRFHRCSHRASANATHVFPFVTGEEGGGR